jgi:hypothetical protein
MPRSSYTVHLGSQHRIGPSIVSSLIVVSGATATWRDGDDEDANPSPTTSHHRNHQIHVPFEHGKSVHHRRQHSSPLNQIDVVHYRNRLGASASQLRDHQGHSSTVKSSNKKAQPLTSHALDARCL